MCETSVSHPTRRIKAEVVLRGKKKQKKSAEKSIRTYTRLKLRSWEN